MTPRPPLSSRLAPFGSTIFSEMTALATAHGAVNLAQGFPDFDGPEFIKRAAVRALEQGRNQYARSQGAAELVSAVASRVKAHYGWDVDPLREVGVFSGATEGIAAAMLGLLEPGDEVILFEPFYDSYPACVAMAGATPRYCTLHLPGFTFDEEELARCFTPRTRLLVLNTPHNPTGRVFTRAELEVIARLCQRHGTWVLTDEVYEHLTWGEARHQPIASLPGMWERTLTLSSTGKTFSLTGWKVGYAVGPAPLVAAAQAAHQFLTFSTSTPFQLALAEALQVPPSFYEGLRAEYEQRRQLLLAVLRRVGLKVLEPEGTYFATVDIGGMGLEDDQAFSRRLTREVGVACIPTSVFYAQAHAQGQRLVRFAFCKQLATLEEAGRRLERGFSAITARAG